MSKLVWLLLVAFCVLVADAKSKNKAVPGAESSKQDEDAPNDDTQQEQGEEPAEGGEESEELTKTEGSEAEESSEADGDARSTDNASGDEEETKEFQCNLKFKRVGCYNTKSKKQKPLNTFIMSNPDLDTKSHKKGKVPDNFDDQLSKFTCSCAGAALNSGNAIFSVKNFGECWTGADDSKYDKDGPSDDCVTFENQKCNEGSELCAGKKHTHFVYYVDTPEHTKSPEEVKKELQGLNKKQNKKSKKKASKKGKKSKKDKKSKKSKKKKQ